MINSLLQQFCSDIQWQKILQFVTLLKTANQTVNLVSRKDIDNIIDHHVAPSFAYKILERIHDNETILDIGSGGGFPGIINAILFPETHFVLVDATRKKVDFLNQAIKQLRLTNIKALWSRVEALATQPKYQHKFDHTTARAVAPLTDLLTWSKPLLKTTGTVEALKGGNINEELAKIQLPVELYYLEPPLHYNEKLTSLVIVSIKLDPLI